MFSQCLFLHRHRHSFGVTYRSILNTRNRYGHSTYVVDRLCSVLEYIKLFVFRTHTRILMSHRVIFCFFCSPFKQTVFCRINWHGVLCLCEWQNENSATEIILFVPNVKLNCMRSYLQCSIDSHIWSESFSPLFVRLARSSIEDALRLSSWVVSSNYVLILLIQN